MTYYIIGGGLAGLAAAIKLKQREKSFHLFEFTARLGGRARSFYDSKLGLTLDNGAHLILHANKALFRYLNIIGAKKELVKLAEEFKFFHSDGKFAYSLKGKKFCHPQIKPDDYAKLLFFCLTPIKASPLSHHFNPKSALYQDYISPLSSAILNLPAEEANAKQFQIVMRRILFIWNGAKSYFVKNNLQKTFIDPAISFLGEENINLKTPLQKIEIQQNQKNKIKTLHFKNKIISLTPQDKVIFALPPDKLSNLLPHWSPQIKYQSILNIHIPYKTKKNAPYGFAINKGIGEWIFVKKDHISITLSGAKKEVQLARELLISKLQKELKIFFPNIQCSLSKLRFIEEKKATLKQTPQNKIKKPYFSNAKIIGDWTHPTLPCTMEAAIETGFKIE